MAQSELIFHRETAKKCFNEAWDYLDEKDRSLGDMQQMLHLAHTARYHGAFVGTAKNLAIGDWQIFRVYAALLEPTLAIQFAKSALELMQKNNLNEILCTGYEGLARAFAVAKDRDSAKTYISKAREHLAKATLNDEDRTI